MNIPRMEHPKPQFERKNWLNLNGEWQFEIDNGKSGVERNLFKDEVTLERTITVPYCPESKLSGVEHKDFMYGVWYKRSFELTDAQLSGRTFIHFGAVDYECDVYINETKVGYHKGGYVSFKFDISGVLKAGTNTIAVFARDDTRDRLIPRGKQCEAYYSRRCDYTRTTGIWQTVWLEFTPKSYIKSVKYYPNITDCSVNVEATFFGTEDFICEVSYEGKPMGSYSAKALAGTHSFNVSLCEKHLWEVGNGRLYDVKFIFGNDAVQSYFGLREVHLDGYKFLINNKSVFQRLILDQGFYPDGIYTAPTDADLLKDIELSLAVGFNGARLHEKIFEERYLYYCDKKGYIAWGEYPNWGLDHTYDDAIYAILPEWTEEIERDFNHPSIVGWIPFNETWDKNRRKQYDDLIRLVYRQTKSLDTTRPCIDTSGLFHVETDIFDVHDYEQNPEVFKANYDKLMTEGVLYDAWAHRQHYNSEPTFVSEYGGIRWSEDQSGWGYGDGPKTKEEFIERYAGLADALLDNDKFFGLCYTQLTDVEQEQNGLYYYDRTPKFDTETLRKIMSRKAAIED